MLVIGSSGDIAMTVVITLSIVVPLTLLVVVCWFFWRAARRADADTATTSDSR